LFYRFVPLEEDYGELSRRLTRLAEAAGVRIRGVFRFDMSRRTRAANAMLIGVGPSRRIVLGDTLLNEFTADEIETVLAHELAHHVHRDIPLGIFFGSVLDLLALFSASLVLRWAVEVRILSAIHDPGGLPLLALALGITGFVLIPLFNAYSRWRESMADRFALCATNKPLAFAAAMIRLADQNLAEFTPKRWVVALLHSHPSLQHRVAEAEAYRASASSPTRT
jgi:STE24 endopeptidase